ncbi:MAG: hypothetical protein WD449_01075, partial [Candidatus Babeliales bacterium]
MNFLETIHMVNTYLDTPTTFLFLGVGIFLTIWNGFLQVRGIPRIWQLITQGVSEEKTTLKTITSLQALFTALST